MDSRMINSVTGGLIATLAMTAMLFAAPIMGMPKMPIGNMLAGFMHLPVAIGWMMHFMIGIILAAGYVFVFQSILPGNKLVKGILYGFIPFVLAQIVVMPIMGAGLFSTNTPAPVMMVIGSLVGHAAYGAALGLTTSTSNVSESYQTT